ncbi:hypothetical protein SNEBB_006804 [Seison nebaliae]|nr:hypothetical protein SNEBB_006804 [Seison nebaliae]
MTSTPIFERSSDHNRLFHNQLIKEISIILVNHSCDVNIITVEECCSKCNISYHVLFLKLPIISVHCCTNEYDRPKFIPDALTPIYQRSNSTILDDEPTFRRKRKRKLSMISDLPWNGEVLLETPKGTMVSRCTKMDEKKRKISSSRNKSTKNSNKLTKETMLYNRNNSIRNSPQQTRRLEMSPQQIRSPEILPQRIICSDESIPQISSPEISPKQIKSPEIRPKRRKSSVVSSKQKRKSEVFSKPRKNSVVTLKEKRKSEVSAKRRKSSEVSSKQKRKSEVATKQRINPDISSKRRRSNRNSEKCRDEIVHWKFYIYRSKLYLKGRKKSNDIEVNGAVEYMDRLSVEVGDTIFRYNINFYLDLKERKVIEKYITRATTINLSRIQKLL